MKRLRYDRPIAMALAPSEKVKVPEAEVWNVTLAPPGRDKKEVALDYGGSGYRDSVLIGAGTKIGVGNGAVITGIAFKEVV